MESLAKETFLKTTRALSLIVFTLALAACGGGGGGPVGNGGGITPPTSAPPTATPTPQTQSVAVHVANCDDTYIGVANATGPGSACIPGTPLLGATIKLGTMPTHGQGGDPLAPVISATTDATGTATLTGVLNGTYEIEIGNGATFATLHAKLVVPATGVISYNLSALSGTEQAWFAQMNVDRGITPALQVDEYAEEGMRKLASAMLASQNNFKNTGADCDSFFKGNNANYFSAYTTGGLFQTWAAIGVENNNDWPQAENDTVTSSTVGPFPRSASTTYVGLAQVGPVLIGGMPSNGKCNSVLLVAN
ncbi:MAG: hypothetical protein M3Y21_06050 [Candidatus Eremiobacteraeota bacterium]|nr:hypothetical protein [Candidatus Eremiobacteraeota bacterium]